MKHTRALTIIADEEKPWTCSHECPMLVKVKEESKESFMASGKCLLGPKGYSDFSPMYFRKEDSYLRLDICTRLLPYDSSLLKKNQ